MRSLLFFSACTIVCATASSSRGHEVTRQAYERALDSREAASLSRAPTLAQVSGPGGGSAAERCLVELSVVDAVSGLAVPALVRVKNARGQALELSGGVNRGVKLRANHPAKEWYVLPDNAVLPLPAEAVTVEAFGGLETELASLALDLRGRKTAGARLALRRFHAPATAGWHAGNTHLHLRGMSKAQADEYLRQIPRADGLELLFVSYLERFKADEDYITNTYRPGDLAALDQPGLRYGNGEEHRHNFGSGGEGYGHVMFLNLPELVRPVSVGPGIAGSRSDYPPLWRGIDQARSQGATVIWCHNSFGFEHAPNWVSGRVHAHNIFDGGSHGSYADTFYRLLNVGLKVPFSTGTDWFIYDFSRAYVQCPTPLSAERWLAGLAAGRSYITNGPLLELRAGAHEIGDTVAAAPGTTFRLTARAWGRTNFEGLELVCNGAVIARSATRKNGGHFVAELNHSLSLPGSAWIAARVALPDARRVPPGVPVQPPRAANEMGEPLFGHTSPIYFEVAGQPLFDAGAARTLIKSMAQGIDTIKAKGRFEGDDQRREILDGYEAAIESLRQRLPR